MPLDYTNPSSWPNEPPDDFDPFQALSYLFGPPPVNPDEWPDITDHFDLRQILKDLNLSGPVNIHRGMPDRSGAIGMTDPDNPRHVYIDTREIHNLLRALTRPDWKQVLDPKLVGEQLEPGQRLTFDSVVRSTVAHELLHVAHAIHGDVTAASYAAENAVKDYGDISEEVAARKFGREHWQDVQIVKPIR